MLFHKTYFSDDAVFETSYSGLTDFRDLFQMISVCHVCMSDGVYIVILLDQTKLSQVLNCRMHFVMCEHTQFTWLWLWVEGYEGKWEVIHFFPSWKYMSVALSSCGNPDYELCGSFLSAPGGWMLCPRSVEALPACTHISGYCFKCNTELKNEKVPDFYKKSGVMCEKAEDGGRHWWETDIFHMNIIAFPPLSQKIKGAVSKTTEYMPQSVLYGTLNWHWSWETDAEYIVQWLYVGHNQCNFIYILLHSVGITPKKISIRIATLESLLYLNLWLWFLPCRTGHLPVSLHMRIQLS